MSSGKQNNFWDTLKRLFAWKKSGPVRVGGFDLIGSKEKAVAIVDIPDDQKDRAGDISLEIMRMNKNVKSVLKKVTERQGKFRLREYELIIGNHNTEVLHKEYGCVFKLDPRKTYFSPREATERQRVVSQVKPGETVMVMFSGVAPYAIQIAKHQPRVKKVIAVEMNPDAVEYAIENMKLNKIEESRFMPVLGDVKDVCPRFYGTCDRVMMPLPLGAEDFLDIAIRCLKKEGGIVHFYSWGKEGDPFTDAIKKVEKAAKKLDRSYEIMNEKKVLPYAPRTFKVCIDFKVS